MINIRQLSWKFESIINQPVAKLKVFRRKERKNGFGSFSVGEPSQPNL